MRVLTEQDIEQINIFEGSKEQYYTFHRYKIINTHKQHTCAIGNHIIPIGTRVRKDEAVIDGKWHSQYNCFNCLAKEYLDAKCDQCDGEGRIASNYYGHPETSDGGRIYYICDNCEGTGQTCVDFYKELKENINIL